MSSFSYRKANINDIAGIASVRVNTWRATYKGIVPDEFLDNLSIKDVSQRLFRNYWENSKPDFSTFVAENETKEVIGFSICGLEDNNDPDYHGEIIALYVLPQYQHQGIGRNLVNLCIHHFVNDLAVTTMLIWVLAANPYRKFYESIGGMQVRTKNKEIGGRIIPEVGYGWQEIDKLL